MRDTVFSGPGRATLGRFQSSYNATGVMGPAETVPTIPLRLSTIISSLPCAMSTHIVDHPGTQLVLLSEGKTLLLLWPPYPSTSMRA
jgi:hypothetical protein